MRPNHMHMCFQVVVVRNLGKESHGDGRWERYGCFEGKHLFSANKTTTSH